MTFSCYGALEIVCCNYYYCSVITGILTATGWQWSLVHYCLKAVVLDVSSHSILVCVICRWYNTPCWPVLHILERWWCQGSTLSQGNSSLHCADSCHSMLILDLIIAGSSLLIMITLSYFGNCYTLFRQKGIQLMHPFVRSQFTWGQLAFQNVTTAICSSIISINMEETQVMLSQLQLFKGHCLKQTRHRDEYHQNMLSISLSRSQLGLLSHSTMLP